MLASEVTPAGRSSVARISSVYACTYRGTSGLVPTKDISPTKILNSCGSSSRRYFLKKRPHRVTRLSLLTVTWEPRLSALLTMVRNLKIRNTRPYVVTRF